MVKNALLVALITFLLLVQGYLCWGLLMLFGIHVSYWVGSLVALGLDTAFYAVCAYDEYLRKQKI